MRKVIAAINMTIDGFCDHTSGIPDDEIHDHYAKLLDEAGVVLYGRKTYELMLFWQTLLKNPSGEKSMDDFAVAIDRVPKIVFSRSLKETGWNSATLSTQSPEVAVKESKQQPGKNIFIGSRSLINQLMQLHLIDEYQLCIHPVVGGSRLPLFENQNDQTIFKLIKTKTFGNGAIILYYEATNKK